jgi:hypothetical protein
MAAASGSQSYATHRQYVFGFHVVLFGLLVVTFIGSCVNLYESLGDRQRLYSASLLVALSFATIMTALYARAFALKAQDRAIRAEEQLRHYILGGSLLDPRLTVRQIVGLRFACDEEFTALARRAAEQGLTEDAIKRAITVWRADTYRA